MFQFRRFPSDTYGFSIRYAVLPQRGFPHSEIRGSRDICSYPRLIAACHVLRRLPVPRHPPCALVSLTFMLRIVRVVRNCMVLILLSYPFHFSLFACSRSVFLLFSFQSTVLSYRSYSIPSWEQTPDNSKLNWALSKYGGLKRTRTSDLTLIRRAL